MNLRLSIIILVAGLAAASCSNDSSNRSRGPIVLGDSSAIVTETDPEALHDQVPDLRPQPQEKERTDTAGTIPAHDTVTTASQPAAPAVTGNGLNVAFKEVTIFIPGITTRSYGKPDLQKARGASYELTGGNLAGAQLRISGGTVSKVSQRYETIIMLKDGSDYLALESLGRYTSAWQPLTGSGGVYNITGLEPARLGFKPATPSAIRTAVQQAARKQRLKRQDIQDWLDAVHNVRAANQAPATVVLRSIMWRVEGKGFSKELRIDVPL